MTAAIIRGRGDAAARIAALEKHLYQDDSIFAQAFRVAGFDGDFLEFGVCAGTSLSEAWWAASIALHRVVLDGALDHSFAAPLAGRRAWQSGFERLRFIGFDSFAGLPALTGPDVGHEGIWPGGYCATLHEALAGLRRDGTPLDNVRLVEGWFTDTLTDDQADKLDLKRLAVVHIDSKLYASATCALAFCTPFLRERTVFVFSDWLSFGGAPHLGSRRAFAEWCAVHPQWHAAVLGRHPTGRIAFVLSRRREESARRRRAKTSAAAPPVP
jgi:hypothetical protein